ncbi:MAG: hypothetical protein M3022_04165 [Actinomycetota bacterium]|nr:hypothetical protein [Actinomycetota bacterium]
MASQQLPADLGRWPVGNAPGPVARRLHVSRPFHVGRTTWCLTADRPSRGVLKVRHGIIQEVGIAPARLVRTRAAGCFFRSFL